MTNSTKKRDWTRIGNKVADWLFSVTIITAVVLLVVGILALVVNASNNEDTRKRHEGYCAAEGGTPARIAGDYVCAYEDNSFIVVPEEDLQ